MSDHARLKHLLGPGAATLLEGAELRAWQPDPDHVAQTYYLLRPLGEAEFRALAQQLGLVPRTLAAPLRDAIWQLPTGWAWAPWQAETRPGALLAQGRVGEQGAQGGVGVWLRWQGGQMQAVLLP